MKNLLQLFFLYMQNSFTYVENDSLPTGSAPVDFVYYRDVATFNATPKKKRKIVRVVKSMAQCPLSNGIYYLQTDIGKPFLIKHADLTMDEAEDVPNHPGFLAILNQTNEPLDMSALRAFAYFVSNGRIGLQMRTNVGRASN